MTGIQRDGRVRRAVGASLPVRCFRRFTAIAGRDRVLALAGQSFTTVVPLLIVVSAIGSHDDLVAGELIRRFRLTDGASDTITALFSRPAGSSGALTATGALVLVFTVFSLARSLRRTYVVAWGLPPLGIRGTVHGLAGLGLLLVQIGLLSVLARGLTQLAFGTALLFVARSAVATVAWVEIQSVLLDRRIPRGRLVPGALVAGVGQAVVAVFSAVFMPGLVARDAERYGAIGVTFALLTWLIVLCAAIVTGAVVSAEVGHRERIVVDDRSV